MLTTELAADYLEQMRFKFSRTISPAMNDALCLAVRALRKESHTMNVAELAENLYKVNSEQEGQSPLQWSEVGEAERQRWEAIANAALVCLNRSKTLANDVGQPDPSYYPERDSSSGSTS